jgi:hypothetical protein
MTRFCSLTKSRVIADIFHKPLPRSFFLPDGAIMQTTFLCSLTGLLLSTGAALAGTDAGCGCLPTKVEGPIKLFRQPPPPPPVHGPTAAFPGVVIFRGEPLPPTHGHAAPAPPVRLFRVCPPPVKLMRVPTPPVHLFRKEVAPPVWVKGAPTNPITVFRREPLPPRHAPTQPIRGVHIFDKPQPPAPGPPPPGCPPPGAGIGAQPAPPIAGGGHTPYGH